MQYDSSAVIDSVLTPGERLLWNGRPRSGIQFRRAELWLIPFSLLWGGFAIFMFWDVVLRDGVPIMFSLIALTFFGIGLYIIFGRFIVDAWQRRYTYYGLTTDRVIVVSGVFQRSMITFELRTLPQMSLSERKDRSGTITFGPPHPWQFWVGGASWPGAAAAPAFEIVENARDVYDRIRRAQRDAHEGRA